MTSAYLVDGVRTPIGRYGGALASVRPDDLAARTIRTLVERHPDLDPEAIDDVVLGCSGLDAVLIAARAIVAGQADLIVAGGVESMSRAPFVMGKAESAFSRTAEVFDTTIGWRFVNERLAERFGTDSMPETAENVAAEFAISRADQDAFALRSQLRAAAAERSGRLARELVAVETSPRRGAPVVVDR